MVLTGKFLFWTLCIVGGLAILGSTLAKNPALPLLAKSLGADNVQIGLIAAIGPVPGILISSFAGAYSDRYGRRRVLLISLFIFATAPFFYLFVTSPWQLIPVRFYHGFATAIFGPVAMAVIAERHPQRRGEKMGLYSSAIMVGRFAAPFIGGLMLTVANYQSVYLACAITGIIALILATQIYPDTEVREAASSPRSVASGLASVAKDRRIIVTSSTEAVQYFAVGAFEAFLPIYALHLGFNPFMIGMLMGVQLISMLLAKPIMGGISDQIGREPMIASGLVLCAAAIAAIPITHDFLLLAALSIVFGIGAAVTTSSTSAFVSDICKKGHYGSAIGVLSSIMDIGHSLGPLSCGIVIAFFGFGIGYGIVAILMFFVDILFCSVVWIPYRMRKHTFS